MLDTEVGPPSTIQLSNFSTSNVATTTHFEQSLGVPASGTETVVTAQTPNVAGGSVVKLNRELLTEENDLETTLAHEYVHVVQQRSRVDRSVTAEFSDTPSFDERLTYISVMEGAAEYVERRYGSRYLDVTSDSTVEWYYSASTAAKQFAARYYFGSRYVNSTIDDPVNLDTVYENPPRTTEELLHGLEPGSEPPSDLNATTNTERETERSGPYGELYVRTLFGTALNESAAARLADGWGNDTRFRFGGGGGDERGDFAWVLRWDDAANATEFENGVTDYLEARNPNASVRIERVGPETTVLFVGDESFVAAASASDENASVTVST